MFFETDPLFGRTDKHQPSIGIAPFKRRERKILLSHRGAVRPPKARRDQVAIDRVGPAVIGANELRSVVAALVTHQVGAMAATVIENPDFVVGTAHHDDGLLTDAATHVVASIWNFAFVADIEPDLAPDL